MTYGEIITMIRLGLGAHAKNVSLFEIGKAIDEASMFIVMALPSRLIPEMVHTRYLNPDENQYDVSLPSDFAEIEAVSFGVDRTATVPNYKPAKIVSEQVWQHRRGKTRMYIASVGEGKLHLSPFPAVGVDGQAPSVEATFKIRPERYFSFRKNRSGAFIQMTQHATNPRMFSFPSGEGWDDYILDADSEFASGGVVSGVTDGGMVLHMRTSGLATADGLEWIVVDSEELVASFTGVTTMLLEARLVTNVTTFLDPARDDDSPQLSEKWHEQIVNLSIAKIMVTAGSQAGLAMKQSAYSDLRNMGANIDFISESRREEATGESS